MTNTYLIAKHLNIKNEGTQIEKCCICNSKEYLGYPKKEIIGTSFMDHAFLNESQKICCYCAACLGYKQNRNETIRTTSFIATESKLIRLKREDIWKHIVFPPQELFVFGVTCSHKKHISFKTEINIPGYPQFSIKTENSNVHLKSADILMLSPILKNWYSVCKETKQEPTWFTKNDILFGCTNFKRIEEYGTGKYIKENETIKPYRQTNFLELLVYALNKHLSRGKENDKN